MARCVHRVNSQNAKKLLLSAVLILVLYLINKGFHAVSQRLLANCKSVRITFWSDQAIHLAIAILLVVGIVSIWFSDPAIWVRGRSIQDGLLRSPTVRSSTSRCITIRGSSRTSGKNWCSRCRTPQIANDPRRF